MKAVSGMKGDVLRDTVFSAKSSGASPQRRSFQKKKHLQNYVDKKTARYRILSDI
ncbi:MAG: hypothetical protein ABIH74_04385 [Candidatus Omnitrophota bacterium]